MAPECAISPSRPCAWCETDMFIADCPRDLMSVVRQYCRFRGSLESFALYGHLGGECRRCLGMIVAMCREALRACSQAPREWTAEDVSQTLFLRILRSAWDPEKAPLGGWLSLIIERIVIDAMKAAYGRHTRTVGGVAGEDGVDLLNQHQVNDNIFDSAELAAQRDLRERLARSLDDLPLDARQLVTLRFVEGYTLQAIAEELATPLSTVARRLQKAVDRVGEMLRERAGAGQVRSGGGL